MIALASAGAPAEPSLTLVRAPALWELGTVGHGVVVANLDSGVDVDHPDLAGRWRGGTNSWYDPFGQHTTVPMDRSGHGTQTMGVMVGGGAAGSAVGVAPGARWIAARIFNDAGQGSVSATHLALQWVLDPDGNPATADAPHVLNNSWTFASGACNLEFAPDIAALRAAGILPVFAAGNFGSQSASPANNPGAFAVGSTTVADTIATDSSRGPSACGEPSNTFPEITAPGVNILSTDRGGFYATSSGTSLAAPHAAGALALLLSARPGLSVAQQEAALIQSAVDLGAEGPDDTFGHGRLDILAAYRSLGLPPPLPPPADTVGPVVSALAATPSPVASGTVTLTATATDAAGTTVAAEWFVGADPGAGSATPLTATDGAFDSAGEGVRAGLDAAALTPGTHSLSVRARDGAGNWGAPVATTVVVDRTGPALSAVVVSPTPTNGVATVVLRAIATDAASTTAGAEWFAGADPGPGNATAMASTGGAFAAASEALNATISTTGMGDGDHILTARARDTAGNWGPNASVTLTVSTPPPAVLPSSPPPSTNPAAPTNPPASTTATTSPGATVPSGALFANGFEGGALRAWSVVSGAPSRIAATTAARREGAFGMRAVVSGSAPSYVQDTTPSAETGYAATFAFAPNGTTTNGAPIDIFAGLTGSVAPVFQVQYRRAGAPVRYQLRIVVTRLGGTRTGAWHTVTNTFHTIGVTWRSGAGGSASLTIDGGLRQTFTGLDTGVRRLVTVRLGPSRGLAAGMAGTQYYDAFASTR